MTAADLLAVEAKGDATVVRFTRRTILDPSVVELVGDQLTRLVRDQGARRIAVDFTRVESLTSAMLGRLALLHREVQAAGGRLVFCHVDPFLQQIFAVARLPRDIPIVADEAAALAALG